MKTRVWAVRFCPWPLAPPRRAGALEWVPIRSPRAPRLVSPAVSPGARLRGSAAAQRRELGDALFQVLLGHDGVAAVHGLRLVAGELHRHGARHPGAF